MVPILGIYSKKPTMAQKLVKIKKNYRSWL